MTDIPTEIAARNPDLYLMIVMVGGVLTFIVTVITLFLRHLKHREEREDLRDERQRETLRELGESCHSFSLRESEANRAMLTQCTTALQQNTATLASNNEILRDVRNVLTRRDTE